MARRYVILTCNQTGHNPVGVGGVFIPIPRVALADSGNPGLEGGTPLGVRIDASLFAHWNKSALKNKLVELQRGKPGV